MDTCKKKKQEENGNVEGEGEERRRIESSKDRRQQYNRIDREEDLECNMYLRDLSYSAGDIIVRNIQ